MKGLPIGTIVRRPWGRANQAAAQGQILDTVIWLDSRNRRLPYYKIQLQGPKGPTVDHWPASHCQPLDLGNVVGQEKSGRGPSSAFSKVGP